MLPEAVLPPSMEHSYAQWLERTYHCGRQAGGLQHSDTTTLPSSVTSCQQGAVEGLPLRTQGMGVMSLSTTYYPVGKAELLHRSPSPEEEVSQTQIKLIMSGSTNTVVGY